MEFRLMNRPVHQNGVFRTAGNEFARKTSDSKARATLSPVSPQLLLLCCSHTT